MSQAVGIYQNADFEALAHVEWLRGLRKATTLADLASGAIKPPPVLFEGLLLHKTVTMVSAEPYSGKTMLLLAAAISAATGVPLLGRHKPNGTHRVLFVGQDAPTWDYARQAMKLVKGYGLSADTLAEAEVDLVLNEGVFIDDKGFLDWLSLWHGATGFDILMLDSFINIHNGNENDNAQMAARMGILKSIRDKLGCAILFSHHTSKPSGDAQVSANYRSRGASSIAASVDFHIQLARRNKYIEFLLPKGRGLDDGDPPEGFTIDVDDDGSGLPAVSLTPTDSGDEAAVLLSFLDRPRKRAEIIAFVEQLGIDPENATTWTDNRLQRLRRAKQIERVGHGVWKAV